MQACLHTSFPSQVKQFNMQDLSFASDAVLPFVCLGNKDWTEECHWQAIFY